MTEFELKIRERLTELKFGVDGLALDENSPLLDDILDSEGITELTKIIAPEIGRPVMKEERIVQNFQTILAILRFAENAKNRG